MYQTYVVKRGDTLYGISNQFGVSVVELANLNKVDANTLQIGQVLNIPNTAGTNPNNMFMYTVKKGDTLYSIAQKYGTTVDAILSLNNLKSSNLQIGDTLRIPENYTPPDDMELPNYINYTVKKGDTLYAIAKNYNIAVDVLKKDNVLGSDTLQIGQILRIRTDNGGNVEECFGPDYTPDETISTIQYIVKKGDSLYKIANNYGTSVSEIMKLNNLTSTALSIGDVLLIPKKNSGPSTSISYIVKKGDNLYSIAQKYNTTVDSIKRKNNLTSNILSIGQILII